MHLACPRRIYLFPVYCVLGIFIIHGFIFNRRYVNANFNFLFVSRIQDLELVEREEEIVRLKEKVCLLEKALSSVEGGEGKCASCALYKETQENLKFEHNKGNSILN